MSFKTRVAAVRDLPANTPVSYGCTGQVGAEGGRMAVLPVGYADGLHRVLSNQGSVWLAGKTRPILGRVCMDQLMADVSALPEVKVGDVYLGKVTRLMQFGAFVELIPGKEGMVHISKLSNKRVEKIEDFCKVGDKMLVKVIEIDEKKRINLIHRGVTMEDLEAFQSQEG